MASRRGVIPLGGGTTTTPVAVVLNRSFVDGEENYTLNWTSAQAVQAAQNVDLWHGWDGVANYVADMKAANPNIVILRYFNGTRVSGSNYSPVKTAGGATVTSYSQSQAAAAGLTQAAFCLKTSATTDPGAPAGYAYCLDTTWNLYSMRPDTPDWQTWAWSQIQAAYQGDNYDGVWLDDCGSGSLLGGATNASGVAYTASTWITATASMAAYCKARVNHVAANGLQNGGVYFGGSSPKPLIAACGIAMAETFCRTPGAAPTVWRNNEETAYVNDFKMIADVEANGWRAQCMTKMFWTGGTVTAAQHDQWRRYGWACYFLGTSNNSSYHLYNPYPKSTNTPNWQMGVTGNFVDPPTANAPNGISHLDLGTPTEAASAAISSGAAHLYVRHWTKGLIVANPTASDSNSYSLGGTYTDLDGNVMTSLIVPAHTGWIFTK